MVAAAIDTYLAFLEADPELYRFVVHQQALDRPADRDPIGSLSDLVGEQAAAAIVGSRSSAPAATRAAAAPWGHGVVGLVRSAADWWLRADRPMLRTELAAHLTDLAWAGLSGVVTTRTPEQTWRRQVTTTPADRGRPEGDPGGPGRPLGARPPRRPREPATTPTSCRSTARPMQEARERVTRAAKKLADSGRVGFGFPKEYGGEDDAGGSVTSIEMLAFGDLSLMVKAGVQWGLFGGAAAAARHRAAPRRRTCATS